MTPDQLTRLTLLLSMTALTGSENQELTFLKSIATPAELASATPESEEEEEEEEEKEDESEKDDPKTGKPGVMDHAKAMTSSKATLVRRNGDLSAQVGRLTAQNQQLTKTIAANATTLSGLQTEIATLKGELTQAKAANKTLSAKVSEELAGLGVKDKDLPGASKGDDKGGSYSSEDEVKAAIEAATSFEEKEAILEAWENRKSA
jgi:chromosome segregation ATPase